MRLFIFGGWQGKKLLGAFPVTPSLLREVSVTCNRRDSCFFRSYLVSCHAARHRAMQQTTRHHPKFAHASRIHHHIYDDVGLDEKPDGTPALRDWYVSFIQLQQRHHNHHSRKNALWSTSKGNVDYKKPIHFILGCFSTACVPFIAVHDVYYFSEIYAN